MRGDHLGPEQVISFAGIRKQRMDGAFFSERIIQCLDELGLEPGVTLTNFWQTFETPAPYDGPEESLEGPLVLKPPVNGTVFRLVTFEPEDPAVLAKLDGKAALKKKNRPCRFS